VWECFEREREGEGGGNVAGSWMEVMAKSLPGVI
jgi:hypothetical protein